MKFIDVKFLRFVRFCIFHVMQNLFESDFDHLKNYIVLRKKFFFFLDQRSENYGLRGESDQRSDFIGNIISQVAEIKSKLQLLRKKVIKFFYKRLALLLNPVLPTNIVLFK